jgi:hypothetical protein
MTALVPEPQTSPFNAGALLDAVEGVSYVIDLNGGILAVGEPNWAEFARANGGQTLLPAARVVGCNLYAIIDGEEVADSYRALADKLISGAEPRISFTYRCDAPDVMRELRMCMSPIRVGGGVVALLYQSLSLKEAARPPISLFDTADLSRFRSDMTLPLVVLCSFCHAVKADATGGRWVEAERYYAAGGGSRVRLSHGICPDCHRAKVGARWESRP